MNNPFYILLGKFHVSSPYLKNLSLLVSAHLFGLTFGEFDFTFVRAAGVIPNSIESFRTASADCREIASQGEACLLREILGRLLR